MKDQPMPFEGCQFCGNDDPSRHVQVVISAASEALRIKEAIDFSMCTGCWYTWNVLAPARSRKIEKLPARQTIG